MAQLGLSHDSPACAQTPAQLPGWISVCSLQPCLHPDSRAGAAQPGTGGGRACAGDATDRTGGRLRPAGDGQRCRRTQHHRRCRQVPGAGLHVWMPQLHVTRHSAVGRLAHPIAQLCEWAPLQERCRQAFCRCACVCGEDAQHRVWLGPRPGAACSPSGGARSSLGAPSLTDQGLRRPGGAREAGGSGRAGGGTAARGGPAHGGLPGPLVGPGPYGSSPGRTPGCYGAAMTAWCRRAAAAQGCVSLLISGACNTAENACTQGRVPALLALPGAEGPSLAQDAGPGHHLHGARRGAVQRAVRGAHAAHADGHRSGRAADACQVLREQASDCFGALDCDLQGCRHCSIRCMIDGSAVFSTVRAALPAPCTSCMQAGHLTSWSRVA